MTRQIMVGGVPVGGGAPVTVQSMTTARTTEGIIKQIKELSAAGCDIVRVAVPDVETAKSIYDIKKEINIPLVADIHFDYKLAIEAAAAGADKIRINPGNIGGADRVGAVAAACRSRGIPIRIGVNGGSLEKELLAKYGAPTPEAMVESAMAQICQLNKFDFDDICVSLKSSDVVTTVRAYELMSRTSDYPLHVGLTEAGTENAGLIYSSVGIGSLLLSGIGDTIRVSLTADPVKEVRAGIEILKAVGLRSGVRMVSCPTCGRTQVNIIELAHEMEKRLETVTKPITVAVMGCVVNGPGEARHADVGVAGGKDCGVLFVKGEPIKKLPYNKLADGLMELIDSL